MRKASVSLILTLTLILIACTPRSNPLQQHRCGPARRDHGGAGAIPYAMHGDADG